MKTIIDKIKDTIAPLVGGRFVYDSEQQLNIILDGEQFPLAFMTLLESGSVVDSAGRFHERMTIEMHFATLADQDMNGEDNERMIDEMKRIALGQWLPKMCNAEGIKLAGVNSTRRIYLRMSNYDTLLTAYVVNLTIEDTESFGLCR